MATWKDGPRYAPTERPRGFAEPPPSVSLEAQPIPARVPPAPTEAPTEFQMDKPAVPLDTIEPTVAAQRDPSEPFASHSAIMTSSDAELISLSAPTVAEDRSPTQPFSIASSPTASALTWAPPPDSARPVQVKHKVSASDAINAAYPPFLITLGVVGVVATIETLIPMVTLAVSPFFLIPRVRFRVDQLKKVAYIILAILAVLWIISFVIGSSIYNISIGMKGWVFVACWGLGVADILLQYLGLRNGETPNITH